RGEFLRRHHLAARDAGLVGRDALDILDGAPLEPCVRLAPVLHAPPVLHIGGRAGASSAGPGFLLGGRHQSPWDVAGEATIAGRGAVRKGETLLPLALAPTKAPYFWGWLESVSI